MTSEAARKHPGRLDRRRLGETPDRKQRVDGKSPAPAVAGRIVLRIAGAGTSIVVGSTSAKRTALLERVAVGRHEGYDRVVFQFRGDGVPGYRVEYVAPPFAEDGSGDPITVDGKAFVAVRMEPASG